MAAACSCSVKEEEKREERWHEEEDEEEEEKRNSLCGGWLQRMQLHSQSDVCSFEGLTRKHRHAGAFGAHFDTQRFPRFTASEC